MEIEGCVRGGSLWSQRKWIGQEQEKAPTSCRQPYAMA